MSIAVAEPENQLDAPVSVSADNQGVGNLASMVKEAALKYLESLDGEEPAQVYNLFLSQVSLLDKFP